MLEFPTELALMVCEELSPRDVARLSRASRAHQALYEPLLYRLYTTYDKGSAQRSPVAVTWAVEHAAHRPEMCAVAEATLAKVERFCQLRCGDLDRGHVHGFRGFSLSRFCIYDSELWPRSVSMAGKLLHMAASAGLDGIVAWLLRHGADVHAPLFGPEFREPLLTALYIAVSAGRVSTAVLLLAYGARLEVGMASAGADSTYTAATTPSVVHLACALGYATMAEQLLIHADNIHYHKDIDANGLLFFYAKRSGNDVPAVAALLLRRGATFSLGTLRALLASCKWQSACELLASPTSHGQMTADVADGMLGQIMLSGRLTWEAAPAAARVVQQLLDAGADPNTGRQLWHSVSRWGWDVVLELLPPFLEAGMVLRHDAEEEEEKKKKTRKQKQGGDGGEAPADDLLGDTSAYEKDQDEDGNAAKLAIVRLLLQYGAPIQSTTRIDALDAYDGPPPDDGMHSRAAWAYRLSSVVLDHCRSTPPDRRGADIEAFLLRYQIVEEAAQTRGRQLLKGL